VTVGEKYPLNLAVNALLPATGNPEIVLPTILGPPQNEMSCQGLAMHETFALAANVPKLAEASP